METQIPTFTGVCTCGHVLEDHYPYAPWGGEIEDFFAEPSNCMIPLCVCWEYLDENEQ